ncbi:MAG: hypothetical protein O2955_10185 [Planctomycetota bacterium]|nr:hypothetical protein [Planctomycetota bacterium]MDA1212879.1 hypothetical protein [Planctomycetota bacterium]
MRENLIYWTYKMVSLWGVLILVCLLWRSLKSRDIALLRDMYHWMTTSGSANRFGFPMQKETLEGWRLFVLRLFSDGADAGECCAAIRTLSLSQAERHSLLVRSVHEASSTWRDPQGWGKPWRPVSIVHVSASDRPLHVQVPTTNLPETIYRFSYPSS